MAGKRTFDESAPNYDGPAHDSHQPNQKRTKTRPTFASVIAKALEFNSIQKFLDAFEPLLRTVVSKEVEVGLHRYSSGALGLTRSPSLPIHQQLEEPSSLRLMFSKELFFPIFTGSKILDIQRNPLQILLMDTRNDQVVTDFPHPIKIEIVVLDGDFISGDGDGDYSWTRELFEKSIVKERSGRRPLLTGDLNVTMRAGDGFVTVGDFEFTDNSSWIRSRRFRVAARVAQRAGEGIRICEAITESFMVKDHRGELYKKHYPPMLEDEVWRLEKIGKGGSFHNKLASKGIHTVQDLLKLSTVDLSKLRDILGGMSEKIWEATLKHARSCEAGNKRYIFRRPNITLVLNSICQIVKAEMNGQTFPTEELTNCRSFLENCVKDALASWNTLEEVDLQEETSVLSTQLDNQLNINVNDHNNYYGFLKPYQQHTFLTDVVSMEAAASMAAAAGQGEGEGTHELCNNDQWGLNSENLVLYNFSGSPSVTADHLTAANARPFL